MNTAVSSLSMWRAASREELSKTEWSSFVGSGSTTCAPVQVSQLARALHIKAREELGMD
jgi:hypothetical protein